MPPRAVDSDPDPHSFYPLDPDSGGKIFPIKTEKSKEIATTCNCIQLAQSFIFSYFKLDPDPHGFAFILPPGSGSACRKTAGSGSAKKGMRIHSPDATFAFLCRRLVSWLVCVSCTCKATGWRCCPPLSAPWTSSAPAPSSSWTTTPGYRPSRTSSCSGSHMSSSTSGQVPGTFNFCYTGNIYMELRSQSDFLFGVSRDLVVAFLKAAPAAF